MHAQVSDTKQQHATTTASEKVDQKYAHAATPLHGHGAGGKKTPRRGRSEGGAADTASAAYVAAVSCSDCRFKQRAVASASPGAVIRSLFVSLTRCSTPRSSPSTMATSASASEGGDGGEQWRLVRDDAVEETARLRHSLAELELKLARHATDRGNGLDCCRRAHTHRLISAAPGDSIASLRSISS
jgi:hypothetical protein